MPNKKKHGNKAKGKGKKPSAPVPSGSSDYDENALVKVKSSDGVEFEMSMKAAKRCGNVMEYLKRLGPDTCLENMEPMPFPEVDSDFVAYVVRWCEHHRDYPLWDEKTKKNKLPEARDAWEHNFMSEFDPAELNAIIMAAYHFDAKCLLDRSSKVIASMIKGKTTEELRRIWNIKNDFTPDEEQRMNEELERDAKLLSNRPLGSLQDECDCEHLDEPGPSNKLRLWKY